MSRSHLGPLADARDARDPRGGRLTTTATAPAAPGDAQAGALTLERVTRRFTGNARDAADAPPAVDALTLEVQAGELLALVGASGSGKTTTLRMAAGYETPDAGRILLDGRDITRLPPERRGFGMVFQHYALFPHLSVEDNVAFGLEARGIAKRDRLKRARDALAAVGLGERGGRAVQALSGGEQQRVALARAVVIEPRVLLLDEPLSNLDPTLRQSTRDELRAMLRRLHLTALFVTHDQEDAFAVADRVALLRDGRLLQVGAPEDLYDRPASRAVAEFIGHAALLPAHDEGTHATIALGDVSRRVEVVRAGGAPSRFPDGRALAVLRPESLGFAPADWADAWPGVVSARRFAGAVFVYHVALDHGPTVELATADRVAAEGDRVGVRVRREPVALVEA